MSFALVAALASPLALSPVHSTAPVVSSALVRTAASPQPGAGTAGDDWAAFRGPNGSGVSAVARIPEHLDAEADLLWRRELAPGYSSPVLYGEYVFLTAAEGKELLTICLERDSGEVSWRAGVDYDGSPRVGQNSPAACTPAVDEERVFSLFHHVGMVAYDHDGRELWRNDLGSPYMIPHGLSSSPVLHGERVVVQIDQDSTSRLVCLDAESGETRWEVERAATHGYSTPSILEPAAGTDGPVQVIVNGALRIGSYDLETGAPLWWVDGAAWQVKTIPVLDGRTCLVNAFMVPSSEFGAPPMEQSFEELVAERDADGDGTISLDEWDIDVLKMAFPIFDLNKDGELDAGDYDYLRSAGREVGGLFAIRTDGRGDVTESHVEWMYDKRRGMSDVLSPVVVDGTVFQLRDGGILTAMDAATGEVLQQERVGSPDTYFASPVSADGKLLLASKGGQLTAVSADREFEQLWSIDLSEEIWSVPALSSEQLLVRSQDALYCFSTAGTAPGEFATEQGD